MKRAGSAIRLFVLLCTVVAVAAKLPSYVTPCNRTAWNYNGCLKSATEKAIAELTSGNVTDGVRSLDPFICEKLEVNYNLGLYKANSVTTNSAVTGFRQAKVWSVSTDRHGDNFKVTAYVSIPRIMIEGFYDFSSSFLFFKLGGKGKYNIKMLNLFTALKIDGSVVGDKLVVKHFDMKPFVGFLQVYFDDLFNGIAILNTIVRFLINVILWPILYFFMLPPVAKAWEPILVNTTNEFFSKLSFSEVFP